MALVEDLRKTMQEVFSYFDLPDDDLCKTYHPDRWDVQHLLNHISDAETVFYDRICRVIAEPRQVIWAFDQDLWAENLQYGAFPLSIRKEKFKSLRQAIIYLAETYYESHGKNEFIHSETGLRTLKDEFEKIAWHTRHHLEQIKKAVDSSV